MAGLSGKIVQVYNFIGNYDIFVLLETFVERGKQLYFENYFPDYNLYWEFAVRESNWGRAKGGKLIGVRKRIESFCKVIDAHERKVIHMNAGQRDEYYIVPIYLSGGGDMEWEREFNTLWEFMIVQEHNRNNMILIGDFNGRIGNGQDLSELTGVIELGNALSNKRESKDKVTNLKGKKILEFCEVFNLIILNGRISGDRWGDFTFMGGRGASVIDLCCVSVELAQMVGKFSIVPEFLSDHFPVEATLMTIDTLERESTFLPLLPKLRWKEAKKKEYISKLENACREINGIPESSEETYELLNNLVYRAANYVPQPNRKREGWKEKWFDKECAVMRMRVFSLLKVFRKSNSEQVRENYMKVVKEYKVLCKNKRQAYYSDIKEQFRRVKDSSDLWNS